MTRELLTYGQAYTQVAASGELAPDVYLILREQAELYARRHAGELLPGPPRRDPELGRSLGTVFYIWPVVREVRR